MKVNWLQLLITVLSIAFSIAIVVKIVSPRKETRTYLIVTTAGKTETIESEEGLVLDTRLGCITNGEKNIRCGIRDLRLVQE
jgi:capsular polysaccharide biosynthesis protein